MQKYGPYHEEKFDAYTAIINGYKREMRLTIFLKKPKWKRPVIAYQADASGVLCLKRLKNQISEFRYAFTQNDYDNLDKNATK